MRAFPVLSDQRDDFFLCSVDDFVLGAGLAFKIFFAGNFVLGLVTFLSAGLGLRTGVADFFGCLVSVLVCLGDFVAGFAFFEMVLVVLGLTVEAFLIFFLASTRIGPFFAGCTFCLVLT